MKKVLFLDRDGVINKEVNYLHKIEDLEIFPGIVDVLKKAKRLGYLVIIITNQAGIAKGKYTEHDYFVLTKYIENYFRENGVEIDKIYYCPHHIDGFGKYKIDCDCRKPKTGMLEQSKKDFGDIDFSNSILAGDKEIDIQAGVKVGIKRLVLVRSGHEINEKNTKANEIIDGLWELNL